MDSTRQTFLDELYAHGRAYDSQREDRLQRLRNVEPETAELLGVLVRAMRATRVLEIGTSNGYSTIWLADAVAATCGSLVSLEVDPARTAMAREHVARAGLADVADLRAADAGEALAAFGESAFDVVFLDAERPAYPGYWPDLVRTLAPGGLLAVDNVLSHAGEVEPFRRLVEADERVTPALVPVGAGVLLVVRDRI
jgi:predicted O-methyltransferase YrrM